MRTMCSLSREDGLTVEIGPERFIDLGGIPAGSMLERFPEIRCVRSGQSSGAGSDVFMCVQGSSPRDVFAVLRSDGRVLCSGMGNDPEPYRLLVEHLLHGESGDPQRVRRASGMGSTAEMFAAAWVRETGMASRVTGRYEVLVRDPRAPLPDRDVPGRFTTITWTPSSRSRLSRKDAFIAEAVDDALDVADRHRSGDRTFAVVSDGKSGPVWMAAGRVSSPYLGFVFVNQVVLSADATSSPPVCRHPALRGREHHYPGLSTSSRVDVEESACSASVRLLLTKMAGDTPRPPGPKPAMVLEADPDSGIHSEALRHGFVPVRQGSIVGFSPPGTLPLS